jgi:hypothetical protein
MGSEWKSHFTSRLKPSRFSDRGGRFARLLIEALSHHPIHAGHSRCTVEDAVPTEPISQQARRVVWLLAAAVFINYFDRGNLATASPLLQRQLALSNSELGAIFGFFLLVCASATHRGLAGPAVRRPLCARRRSRSLGLGDRSHWFGDQLRDDFHAAHTARLWRKCCVSLQCEVRRSTGTVRSTRPSQRIDRGRPVAWTDLRDIGGRFGHGAFRLAPGIHRVRRSIVGVAHSAAHSASLQLSSKPKSSSEAFHCKYGFSPLRCAEPSALPAPWHWMKISTVVFN